jgi:hypothetical protein
LIIGAVTPRHGGEATIRVYSQDGSLAVALAMELEAEQKAAGDENGPLPQPSDKRDEDYPTESGITT